MNEKKIDITGELIDSSFFINDGKGSLTGILEYFTQSGQAEYCQGKLLKEIREELGITQKEMSERLNLSQSTLSVHEKRTVVNADILDRYLNELGFNYLAFRTLLLVLPVLDTDFSGLVHNQEKYLKIFKEKSAEGLSQDRKQKLNSIIEKMENMPDSTLKEVERYIHLLELEKREKKS